VYIYNIPFSTAINILTRQQEPETNFTNPPPTQNVTPNVTGNGFSGGGGGGGGGGGTITDTIPPTVGSISPTSAFVNTLTTFSTAATDNVAVSSCIFYWDGISQNLMIQSDSTFTKDYTPTTIGTHTASVTCVDSSGNTGSNSVSITVNSQPPTEAYLCGDSNSKITGVQPNPSGDTFINQNTTWCGITQNLGGKLIVGSPTQFVEFNLLHSNISVGGDVYLDNYQNYYKPLNFTANNSTIILNNSMPLLYNMTIDRNRASGYTIGSTFTIVNSKIRGPSWSNRAIGVLIKNHGTQSDEHLATLIIKNSTFQYMGNFPTPEYFAMNFDNSQAFNPASIIDNNTFIDNMMFWYGSPNSFFKPPTIKNSYFIDTVNSTYVMVQYPGDVDNTTFYNICRSINAPVPNSVIKNSHFYVTCASNNPPPPGQCKPFDFYTNFPTNGIVDNIYFEEAGCGSSLTINGAENTTVKNSIWNSTTNDPFYSVGVGAWYGNNEYFKNNTVYRGGITLAGGLTYNGQLRTTYNSRIEDNTIYNGTSGGYSFQNYGAINLITPFDIKYFYNISISRNKIFGTASGFFRAWHGIAVRPDGSNSSLLTIDYNRIDGTSMDGINIVNLFNSSVSNNVISNSRTGINITNFAGNVMKNNTIINPQLYHISLNNTTNNNITDILGYVIRLDVYNNNRYYDMNIENSGSANLTINTYSSSSISFNLINYTVVQTMNLIVYNGIYPIVDGNSYTLKLNGNPISTQVASGGKVTFNNIQLGGTFTI